MTSILLTPGEKLALSEMGIIAVAVDKNELDNCNCFSQLLLVTVAVFNKLYLTYLAVYCCL